MITYDDLVNEIDILLDDRADLPKRYKGLYLETQNNKIIFISKYLKTETEKKCVLAEELGHFHKTIGNIVNQRIIGNVKQEQVALRWAYEKLVTLDGIVAAYYSGLRNRFEFAEYLGVTEDFLQDALTYYKNKYGLYIYFDCKTIHLETLIVFDQFCDCIATGDLT